MSQQHPRVGGDPQRGHALVAVVAGTVIIGGLLYSTTMVSNSDLRSARSSIEAREA